MVLYDDDGEEVTEIDPAILEDAEVNSEDGCPVDFLEALEERRIEE